MNREGEPDVMGMEVMRRDVTAREMWRVGSGRSWNWRMGMDWRGGSFRGG